MHDHTMHNHAHVLLKTPCADMQSNDVKTNSKDTLHQKQTAHGLCTHHMRGQLACCDNKKVEGIDRQRRPGERTTWHPGMKGILYQKLLAVCETGSCGGQTFWLIPCEINVI